MRLAVIADDESFLKGLGADEVDLLLSCGDISDDAILRASGILATDQVMAVKGNHDSSAKFTGEIFDLHLRVREIGGVRFGGFQGSWRYKPRGNYLYEQEEVTRLMATFPQVDVFIAHNSPRGIHDREDEVHFGFEAFNGYLERVRPRLFVHGHQHLNQESIVGNTRVVGIFGFRILDI